MQDGGGDSETAFAAELVAALPTLLPPLVLLSHPVTCPANHHPPSASVVAPLYLGIGRGGDGAAAVALGVVMVRRWRDAPGAGAALGFPGADKDANDDAKDEDEGKVALGATKALSGLTPFESSLTLEMPASGVNVA